MKTENVSVSEDQAVVFGKMGYKNVQDFFDTEMSSGVAALAAERKSNLADIVLSDADLVAQIVEDKKLDPITFAPVQDQEVAS